MLLRRRCFTFGDHAVVLWWMVEMRMVCFAGAGVVAFVVVVVVVFSVIGIDAHSSLTLHRCIH